MANRKYIHISILSLAICLSCLVHAVAALSLMESRTFPEPKDTLVIELLSQQVKEKSKSRTSEVQETNRRLQKKKQGSGFQFKEEKPGLNIAQHDDRKNLPVPVNKELVKQALARIQSKISPLWQQAEPPGIGAVDVRLEIDDKGAVRSLWIIKLHGDQKLGQFVAALIRKAAPFPEVASGPAPLVVDCAFEVTGGSFAENG